MWRVALACLWLGAILAAFGQVVAGVVLLALGFSYVLIRAN
jgi:hypothetical protein